MIFSSCQNDGLIPPYVPAFSTSPFCKRSAIDKLHLTSSALRTRWCAFVKPPASFGCCECSLDEYVQKPVVMSPLFQIPSSHSVNSRNASISQSYKSASTAVTVSQ